MGSPVLKSKYQTKDRRRKAILSLSSRQQHPGSSDKDDDRTAIFPKTHKENVTPAQSKEENNVELTKLNIVNQMVQKAVRKNLLNSSLTDIFDDEISSLPSPSKDSQYISSNASSGSPLLLDSTFVGQSGKRQKCSPTTQNSILALSGDTSICSPRTQLSEFNSQESQSLKRRLRNRILATPNLGLYAKRVNAAIKLKQDMTTNAELEPLSSSVDVGPFFGLPSKVKDLFEQHRGITKLYDWQKECVEQGVKGKNLLVSLPTSGGKTLVAEILMLRQVLLYQKDVLLILPYVTLVQEKVRGLSTFAVDLKFVVEEYAGSKGVFPPSKHRRNVIYIATIEKASGLIDYLVEEKRIDGLGLAVVDEVHMVGDSGGRGAKLESCIIKLKLVAEKAQILAMSATVGNLSELGQFLKAEQYTGNFRPVPLTEHVKIGDKIAQVNSKAKTEEELFVNFSSCTYPMSSEQKKRDVDRVTCLVQEVIPKHSCLIFCPTKLNAEAVAKLVAHCLPKDFLKYRTEEKKALLRALKAESSGEVCPIFRQIVPYGIGYHHSGLTEGERKLIEEGYQQGTLSCLSCTSTLAAGVNLPARRVIIRAPYIGKDFLSRSRYQQMVGRAGRAGLDSQGESFVLSAQKDLQQLADLLLSPVEKCISKLGDNESNGLTELVFAMLGLNVVTSLGSVRSLIKESLFYLQADTLGIDVEQVLAELVEKQKNNGFLSIRMPNQDSESSEHNTHNLKESPSPPEEELLVSRLGKAAIRGCIDLSVASELYKDLIAARDHLALHSHLHLLYLVTPYSASESLPFKGEVFSLVYNDLSEHSKEVANLLGITEAVVVKLSTGQQAKKLNKEVLQRFYVSVAIHRIMKGESVHRVSQLYKTHRGLIQQLIQSAGAFASCVNNFCQGLEELWAFQDLLTTFSKKVSVYCNAELLPLLELPAVKMGRARLLFKAGFCTLSSVAKGDPNKIVAAVDHLSFNTAYQMIASAKVTLHI